MPKALFLAAVSTLFLLTPLLAQGQSEDNTLHIPPKLNVQVSTGEDAFVSILIGSEREQRASQSNEIFIRRDERVATIQLLPMVFFEQGSSAIPERYQTFNSITEVNDYRETNGTVSNRLGNEERKNQKYLEVLNIIGYRMRRHPETTIRVEGGYSSEPGESAELARERGEVIREYLQNVWRIAPERIGTLPPRIMADSSSNILQQEEARRVIIQTDDWQLISPVNYSHSSFNVTLAVFSISLDPWVVADDIASIKILIASDDDLLSATQLPVSPDSAHYQYTGVWVLPRHQDKLGASIEVEAIVETQSGILRRSNRISIPVVVEESTITFDDESEENFERGYFNTDIPFFESGDTTLSPLQQLMLEQAVGILLQRKNSLEEFGRHVGIEVILNTEVSENPLADFTAIQAEHFAQKSEKAFVSSLFNDPSFQVPLYILSPSLFTETPNRMERLSEDLSRVWFGDRFDEIQKMSEMPQMTR
ncbi:MAG: hypothetical protein AB7H80_12635, partial [Candidatus Kapaibacterium sp.]